MSTKKYQTKLRIQKDIKLKVWYLQENVKKMHTYIEESPFENRKYFETQRTNEYKEYS